MLRLASNSNDALKESCLLPGTGYSWGLQVQQCMEMVHFTYDNSSEVRMAGPALLGMLMREVNPISQLQGADWCSAPAHSTQLQHLKYIRILPFSVHKPQGRAIKAVFTCMLCSVSFWALVGEKKKLFGSKLFSNATYLLKRLGYLALRAYSPFSPLYPPVHHIQQTRSMWKANHATAASHRLLVSFWSQVRITTKLSPSWSAIKIVN